MVHSGQAVVIHSLHSDVDHGQRVWAACGQLCRLGNDIIDDVTQAFLRAGKYGEGDVVCNVKDMTPVNGQVFSI